MLGQTKQFLRENGYYYKKSYIRPMMVPDNVYVFHFGRKRLKNRLIVRYGHRWTGRQKINEIDLRLHKQKHPRVFKNEYELLTYLKTHLLQHERKLAKKRAKAANERELNQAKVQGEMTE